jgi:peptidoglycan/xylan/chitin deacetylase (PgdA/CDA1 family)
VREQTEVHPRDLRGFDGEPPAPTWPGGSHLALNFIVNVEDGGERTLLNSDDSSESRLTDLYGMTPQSGVRNLLTKSTFEYGSRIGFWRVQDFSARNGVPWTAYCIGRALEQTPEGYFAGLPSLNTRRLAVEAGYTYDCDAYNEECPYWVTVEGAGGLQPHLVICYTLTDNDSRFAAGHDFVWAA